VDIETLRGLLVDRRMNILFINQPTSEYGQSLLYHGLYSLGHHVVPLYPNTFHFDSLEDCAMECSNPESPCSNIKSRVGCTNHPAHLALPNQLGRSESLQVLIEDKTNWDLVVTNNGYGHERLLRNYIKRGIPVACLDLGDSPRAAFPEWSAVLDGPPKLFFRREYHVGQPGFPLSYSYYGDRASLHELAFPVWDVACLYRPTNPQRAKIGERIREAFPNSVVGQKPHSEYLETIGSSLFSVALPGAGEDTLRHWEIPSQGSVLCKPKSSIIVNNDFTGGVNCIEFEDAEDLVIQIKSYLNGPHGLYNKLRDSCYQHFLKYHTTKARASEFLNHCGF